MSVGFSSPLCNYFTQRSTGGCVGYDYNIFKDLTEDMSVGELLDSQPVPVVAFFMEDNFLAAYGGMASVQAFLANPEQQGWKLVYLEDNSTGRWRLYVNARRFNISSL